MEPRLRTPVWLTALGIAVIQVAGSFGAEANQPERRTLDAVAVVLVLLGPAALAVRDRWPRAAVVVSTAAAAAYIGRGHPYGPVFVSVVVALYGAVQAGHRRAAWAMGAAGYAAFLVAEAVDPRAEDLGLVHWSLVAGWLVGILAVSELVRNRRDQAADAQRRRDDEQRLGLAQELHDVLAHNISLVNVQASVALHLLDEQPERARPALAAIKAASHDALQELRAALDTLRRGDASTTAAPRAPTPRMADLDDLVDGVRSSGLDVRIERDAPPGTALPGAVELAAFRIVQEALTNVTRHARARSVTVRVAYGDGNGDGVDIEVVDDGVGGACAPGNGIVGMRERAASVGGTLEAGPRPGGGGFRVAAHLPVPA